MTPMPNTVDLKPGAAMNPLYGVQPAIVDAEGNELTGAAEGNLILKDSCTRQMRTVWGDHKRFLETYFSTYPGAYFTGDGSTP